jgi:UDP-2,3-diacylglucosamine pyrophosphatase LpxH
LATLGQGSAELDRLVLVLSDLEMGAGGLADDCPHAGAIAERLVDYARSEPDRDLTFVLNGDVFDLLKTPVADHYPRHVTVEIALAKLERVAAAHPDFFERLGQALRTGRAERRAVLLPGNHDLEVLFPEVQARIRTLVGTDEAQLSFPGLGCSIGEAWIEHGSQGDILFRVDPERPFLEYEGHRILNLPWASVGLLEAVVGVHKSLWALDRVKPRQALFRLMPEVESLLMRLSRRYWARDFWRGFFLERDPLKVVSWTIVKEVLHRFRSRDADVSFGDYYRDAMRADLRHRVYVVGHQHRERRITDGEKLLLQTGCLRNEYLLEPDTGALRPAPKSYAELQMRGDRVLDARLIPFVSPPAPDGYVPEDLRALLPEVRKRLAELDRPFLP